MIETHLAKRNEVGNTDHMLNINVAVLQTALCTSMANWAEVNEAKGKLKHA